MEGELQDQGKLYQDLEEWLSPRGIQSVHGFFSEEENIESIVGNQPFLCCIFSNV